MTPALRQLLGIDATPPSNPIELAEQLGELEIQTWFQKPHACITIGKYLDLQLRVWGVGETVTEAVEAALMKAEKVAKAKSSKLIKMGGVR